ncbi:MAG: M23 family metallopeptidase [candidate division KSB1 bacterium]|nr:M23 family metallopeptidase [candidate division KSB1 bacterium]
MWRSMNIKFKKKSNRKQHISILLIPDDYTDPFTFRISIRALKVVAIVASLLVVHIFAGMIFYYKYFVTNRYRHQLERENINLKEDSRKISVLYDKVEEIVQYNSRLRSVLQVDQGFERSDRKISDIMNTFRRNINLLPEQGVSNGVMPNAPSNTGRQDFIFRSKGTFHELANNIPTFLPVEGYLTTNFRRGDWLLPDHLGIDLATSRGSTVHAAADGVVIFAKWTEDLGNLIILYHFNGFLTFYGHNQILLKKENSLVRKGETIALLGSSGRSTAPHLHFEIWKDGVPVDPKAYLLITQNK